MGQITFARPLGNESVSELADMVAKMQKELEFLANGNLSTSNVREISGWQVSQDRFQAYDGMVGLYSAYGYAENVRFWAGSPLPDIAPWRVYDSGRGVATGWTIQSKDGSYPYVAVDPVNDLFGAYTSPAEFIRVGTQPVDGLTMPYVLFGYAGDFTYMYHGPGGFGLSSGGPMFLNANYNDLKLSMVKVDDWSRIRDLTTDLGSVLSGLQTNISAFDPQLASLWSAISALQSQINDLSGG
ncbi:hypothetical protein ACTHPH_24050 [Paenibacillus pasadenensis]|uniref:hypothetical protein n=1 Tax=Paenibacillus pasadenensis TaxID=217090 RepID=UPI00048FAC08|nr:hypothetical protein [Paenibacillus pasadenensis]